METQTTKPPFTNREEAGRTLAARLSRFANCPDAVVLAIPGGAVEVGRTLATALRLPFDILIVSVITAPAGGREPIGAMTSGGVRMLNFELIDRLHLSDAELRKAILRKAVCVSRREQHYRDGRPSIDLADRTVILADDGASRCETIRNAIRLLHRRHAERIIIATPAACQHAASDLGMEADEFVSLTQAEEPQPPAAWFMQCPRTTSRRVKCLLHAAG